MREGKLNIRDFALPQAAEPVSAERLLPSRDISLETWASLKQWTEKFAQRFPDFSFAPTHAGEVFVLSLLSPDYAKFLRETPYRPAFIRLVEACLTRTTPGAKMLAILGLRALGEDPHKYAPHLETDILAEIRNNTIEEELEYFARFKCCFGNYSLASNLIREKLAIAYVRSALRAANTPKAVMEALELASNFRVVFPEENIQEELTPEHWHTLKKEAEFNPRYISQNSYWLRKYAILSAQDITFDENGMRLEFGSKITSRHAPLPEIKTI